MGDNQGMIRALTGLAQDAVDCGEDARARRLFAEALATMRPSGDHRWLAPCLGGLAALSATLQPEPAVRLAAAAEALHKAAPAPQWRGAQVAGSRWLEGGRRVSPCGPSRRWRWDSLLPPNTRPDPSPRGVQSAVPRRARRCASR
jgi:hypothetical protein